MEAILNDLQARLEFLKSEREQLMQSIMQAQANLNAYNGAIQETERMIALLTNRTDKPEE